MRRGGGVSDRDGVVTGDRRWGGGASDRGGGAGDRSGGAGDRSEGTRDRGGSAGARDGGLGDQDGVGTGVTGEGVWVGTGV